MLSIMQMAPQPGTGSSARPTSPDHHHARTLSSSLHLLTRAYVHIDDSGPPSFVVETPSGSTVLTVAGPLITDNDVTHAHQLVRAAQLFHDDLLRRLTWQLNHPTPEPSINAGTR